MMKMIISNWKPTHLEVKENKNTNNIEIHYVNEVLAHSIKAKEILLELGDYPVIDSNIARIYSNMDLSSAKKDSSLLKNKTTIRNQLFLKLGAQVGSILKN